MRTFINILLILVTLILNQEVYAETYYVEVTGDDSNPGTSADQPFRTLNKAFLYVSDNDTVVIGEGVFTLSRTLEWDGNLVLKGSGPDKTVVQAAEEPLRDKEAVYTFSVFYNMQHSGCSNTLPKSLIQDITIQNGAAPVNEPMPTSVGGGLKNFAELTIRNCIIENNSALSGGGIYNDGVLILENSILRNNYSFNMEGAVYNTSDASYTEENCTFESNSDF